MSEFKIRCSSLGRIMTEPKSKSDGPLSVGAKTAIREIAAQAIFGVDFEISSKYIEKGLEVEDQSIALLNRVRGLSLEKNKERRSNDFITGECDLFDAQRRRGHDLKSSWSLQTFPAFVEDCEDWIYEWQMRGYMMLWDADEWEVNYAMVDTPDRLIGFEPMQLHIVSHIPEHMRLTTWVVKRDADKEALIAEKTKAGHAYYLQCIDEFDRAHRVGNPVPADVAPFVATEAVAEASAEPAPMKSRLASALLA